MKNNDIKNIINNINNNIKKKNYFISNYNNLITKNKKDNKEYKYLDYNKKKNTKSKVVKGDWTCQICFNLNFSFRKACNRCNAVKPK